MSSTDLLRTGFRVALIAPPWFPVPPPKYGGTEAIVAHLAEGLVERGVDVTVFASGDSETSARLEYVHPTARSVEIGQMAIELEHVLACLSRADEFDLIHDHSGLLALSLARSLPVPFVHTAHGPLVGPSGVLYSAAVAFNPDVGLISLTRAQQRAAPHLPWIAACPNGIDVASFPFRAEHDGYLAFLGRMSPEKGAGRAAVTRVARCSASAGSIAPSRRSRIKVDFSRSPSRAIPRSVLGLAAITAPTSRYADMRRAR